MLFNHLNRFVLYSLLTLLLLGGWFYAATWGPGKKRADAIQKLAELNAKVKRLQEIKDTYDTVQRRFKQKQAEFDSLEAKVPTQQEYVELLQQIRDLATKQNLNVKSLAPEWQDSFPPLYRYERIIQRKIVRYPVHLVASGTFLQVGAFLESLGQLPKIVNLDHLTLETNLQEANTLTCEIVLHTYTRVEAQGS